MIVSNYQTLEDYVAWQCQPNMRVHDYNLFVHSGTTTNMRTVYKIFFFNIIILI